MIWIIEIIQNLFKFERNVQGYDLKSLRKQKKGKWMGKLRSIRMTCHFLVDFTPRWSCTRSVAENQLFELWSRAKSRVTAVSKSNITNLSPWYSSQVAPSHVLRQVTRTRSRSRVLRSASRRTHEIPHDRFWYACTRSHTRSTFTQMNNLVEKKGVSDSG